MSKYFTILLFFSSILQAGIDDCGTSKKSKELAKLILDYKYQNRTRLICDKTLSQAAFDKAHALAKANKITHKVNHTTPNESLRKHNIQLPIEYEILGNQVEAIQGGVETAQQAFDYFLTSPDHKAHILGENSFYLKQNHIGVGYFNDEKTDHEDFWVVYITAFKNPNNQLKNKTSFRIVLDNKSKKTKHKRFKKGDTLSRGKFNQ